MHQVSRASFAFLASTSCAYDAETLGEYSELARADQAEFCATKSCAQLSYELANSKQLVATLSAELKETQDELTRVLVASRSG